MRAAVSPNLSVVVGGLSWGVCLAAGMSVLLDYSGAPSPPAKPPMIWPARSPIQQDSSSGTLLMFAHPRCPCTRASLNELARLMARAQGGVKGFILFYQPEEFPEDWSRTDLWWTAASIEGVTVLADVNGENASQFGAATSGQVLLYSPSGELRYAGGLTGLRGHEGPNQGSKMLYSLIHDDCGPGVREFPVFGCAILDPEN